MRAAIGKAIEAACAEAEAAGLSLVQSPQGLMVGAMDSDGKPRDLSDLPAAEREGMEAAGQKVRQMLAEINRDAARRQADLAGRVQELNRAVAENAVGGLVDTLTADFSDIPGLNRWLVAFRVDLLDNLALFRPQPDGAGDASAVPAAPQPTAEARYAVNLLVDNGEVAGAPIVLEGNPTYANLFGQIEYRQAGGVLATDYTLIQPGALHRANGGVLVLRAEAIAAHPDSWAQLKGALRDGVIRMEEQYRAGGVPVAGAPKPAPVALDVKVIIVGAPQWYYTFFSVDPEFQAYFKVKAAIDADMAASPENLGCYAGLLQGFANKLGATRCTPDAIDYLLGYASRIAADRSKLSARFELVEDIVNEAIYAAGKGAPVDADAVRSARHSRRNRNGRIEDRSQEAIERGTVMISTTGSAVGQINGLTVRDMGDHAFGTPARVTARASVGRRGVTNIERETALGGPIQQKGALVIQGFLAGMFARRAPLSFNASITFEQSYGGVEGDSASLAEVLAILSDLADVPLRQDLAVTGSVNQSSLEAGTSPLAKEMLAKAGLADVASGIAPDMFEMGAHVQILSRGSMYAKRSYRLYDAYKTYDGWEAIPEAERGRLHKILGRPFDEIWGECLSYWGAREPAQVERAEREPRHKMALVFRWYLGMASRWARLGERSRKKDFQIWCGPAMGGFNEWVKGSSLEPLPARNVVAIADALLLGASVVERCRALERMGVSLPAGAGAWRYSSIDAAGA